MKQNEPVVHRDPLVTIQMPADAVLTLARYLQHQGLTADRMTDSLAAAYRAVTLEADELMHEELARRRNLRNQTQLPGMASL